MRYLCYTVTYDINDRSIKLVINYFNVKVNQFIGYVNDVACDIKDTLFKKNMITLDKLGKIYTGYLLKPDVNSK